MAELRMIDANALDVIRFAPTGGDMLDATERGWNECISFLQKKAPTIDAVPVVRCRECKESEQCPLIGADNLYCNVWDTVVHCDGFCYQGAKMDGGAVE